MMWLSVLHGYLKIFFNDFHTRYDDLLTKPWNSDTNQNNMLIKYWHCIYL